MPMPNSVPSVFKIIQTPGPGTYKPVDGITMEGTYAKSGHMRTKTPKMRKSSSSIPTKHDRVPPGDKHKPGPGWYDHNPQTMSSELLNRALPMTTTRYVNNFGR